MSLYNCLDEVVCRIRQLGHMTTSLHYISIIPSIAMMAQNILDDSRLIIDVKVSV